MSAKCQKRTVINMAGEISGSQVAYLTNLLILEIVPFLDEALAVF
jgi:hypothetical protein